MLLFGATMPGMVAPPSRAINKSNVMNSLANAMIIANNLVNATTIAKRLVNKLHDKINVLEPRLR